MSATGPWRRRLPVLAMGAAAAGAAAGAAILPGSILLPACAAAGGAWLAWGFARRRRGRAVEADRLLAHLADTVGQPRAIIGKAGEALWANAAFQAAFGAEPSGAAARILDLLGADDAARAAAEAAWQAAQRGEEGGFEVAGRDTAGGATLQAVRVLCFDRDGGATSWMVEDRSARRRIEDVLAAERAKVVDFLERAPVGFYATDAAGRFTYMNATLARWLGRGADAEAGFAAFHLHDALADRPPPGTPAHDPFGGASGSLGEAVLRGGDGRRIPVVISQAAVTGADGLPGYRAVVRDLGPEREMAAALARTGQGFRRLFEDAPVAIARLDAAGRIDACNAAFGRLTGLTPERVRGARLVDLLQPEERAEIADRLDRIARAADPTGAMEARLAGGGGREIVVSLFAGRVEPSGGGGAELVLHFLDLSDQKRLEVQFAQSQKMQAVGQLAGGVAHDFNNLLTAMIGFCDLLLQRHRPGDPSFADIMQVKQNANRAANLVRQLLAFSRQQTLQPKVLDITDPLTELTHLLRRLIGGNIALKMIHARDLHPVRVDQGQFEQVVINLAVNARDAMPEGGALTIRTANHRLERPMQRGVETLPAGDYVMVEVADTGIGIPPENLGRIFEPFFSTKEVGSGTGLGLSTVYGIVKQTGGFVLVDSRPGAGAVFRILLPRWQGEAPPPREAAVEARRLDTTGAGTVLLVEDEDAVRLFSSRALRNKGYTVLEAKSGENALEILAAEPAIDLLITDVVMPQMDGTELIRQVRLARPAMRVVCISGYAEEAFRKRLDSEPGVQFLPKPFTLEQLAGAVKDALP